MTGILEELVKSPRLPRYLAELHQLIISEQERRQRFYDEMNESQKVEFINGEGLCIRPLSPGIRKLQRTF